jgi:hypothetical protein
VRANPRRQRPDLHSGNAAIQQHGRRVAVLAGDDEILAPVAPSKSFLGVDVGLDTMYKDPDNHGNPGCPDTIDASVGLAGGRYDDPSPSRPDDPIHFLSAHAAFTTGYGGAGLGPYIGWTASLATTFVFEDVWRGLTKTRIH